MKGPGYPAPLCPCVHLANLKLNTIQTRNIDCNGLRMRIAEAGPAQGPLIILAHGWPESWYSWRHQIPFLAAAGYHVIAPDMRGYGGTEAPRDTDDYNILHLAADMAGLVEWSGEEQAAIVGHDWGAMVAWHAALLYPDRFRAVAALSVPYFGRPHDAPTRIWKQRFGDNFFYILYHQEPGVAESEYDADPRALLSMLYASPDTPRHARTISNPHRSAGGWIGRWGAPKELPAWLSEADLDFYVDEFTRTGFRGGLNYYRNFDRNWSLMAEVDPVIKIPALFIVGDQDLTIEGYDLETLRGRIQPLVPGLKGIEWMPGIGHWIQQERPEQCNQALLAFLN